MLCISDQYRSEYEITGGMHGLCRTTGTTGSPLQGSIWKNSGNLNVT